MFYSIIHKIMHKYYSAIKINYVIALTLYLFVFVLFKNIFDINVLYRYKYYVLLAMAIDLLVGYCISSDSTMFYTLQQLRKKQYSHSNYLDLNDSQTELSDDIDDENDIKVVYNTNTSGPLSHKNDIFSIS